MDTNTSLGTNPPLNAPAKRVLIVDDDEEIRDLLRILFETDRFEVVGEAADGPNGLVLAMRHGPDFIVLDYMMPGMNGAETAHFLREMAPGSRIVAFSAILTEKPDWADAFLDKSRVGEAVPLLKGMAEALL